MGINDRGVRAAGAFAITAIGATLGLAGTAAAQTPATLAVNAACYVTVGKTAPPMTITGSGFATDGSQVNISDSTGSVDTTVNVSPTGTIAATVTAPSPFLLEPGAKSDTITATQFPIAGGEIEGTATTELSELGVTFSTTKREPGLGAYRQKSTFRFSGFPEGKTLWGHYFLGRKLVARQSFGTAQGPCGVLVSRKRVLPVTPHSRNYNMVVDASKAYHKTVVPRVLVKFRLMAF